jgi:hypothetical protein
VNTLGSYWNSLSGGREASGLISCKIVITERGLDGVDLAGSGKGYVAGFVDTARKPYIAGTFLIRRGI